MPYYENKNVRYLKSVKYKIKESIYQKVGELDVECFATDEPVSFVDRFNGQNKKCRINESWGKLWDCAWFRFAGEIPQAANGKKVVLRIDISGELFIADQAGNPVRGLTTKASTFDKSLGEPEKTEFPYTDCAVAGEKIEVWADGANNDLFGNFADNGVLKLAEIAIVRDNVKRLYYDWEVLLELAEYLPADSAQRDRILFLLNEAAAILRTASDEEVQAALDMLQKELSRKNGDYPLQVSAIGHGHMDLAWLWPIRETKRKIARTFATVVRNMEKYPDYVYGVSQAQQLKWLKDYYPSLYAQVKEYIIQGRIDLMGGSWVESDGSLPSGEAFVRQHLYGQQFFQNEFGKRCQVGWLPDTFGFPANLPQIFAKSGIKYFVSTRIVMNSHYKYHNSFWWKGLDGSKILTHVIPETTYNSSAAPRALIHTEKNYMDKGISENALVVFGIGDGGGGPGEEHLERLVREKDLHSLPPVTQESVQSFFEKLSKDGEKFKTWYGEIFFNTFQGTFSSQSRIKHHNRKIELCLRELEYASILAESKIAYPKEKLDAYWEEALLYQFHDILPGSSIERVNNEAMARYQELRDEVTALTETVYSSLVAQEDQSYTVFNSLPWDRSEWVKYNGTWILAENKAFGAVTGKLEEVKPSVSSLTAEENLLENDCVKVIFNSDGSIQSIYDKVNQKEILKDAGNVLSVYEDYGDGWQIQQNYRDRTPERFEHIESTYGIDGPSAYRKSKYQYKNSTIEQTVILLQGSPRVDFRTELDMQDAQRMVRTSFPVTIHTEEAVCEIQFGNVARPMHENTQLDCDRFETYAHKWVDYSDNGYGVALLNDGKYGHSIRNQVLDLDLARTTSYPGEHGDIGKHSFAYAIYPHQGNYRNGVIKEAYQFNAPQVIIKGKLDGIVQPAISVDKENIIIETFKKAEDGDGVIVRMYEAYGQATTCKLNTECQLQLLDMLEEPIAGDPINYEQKTLTFAPFEVHTLRMR